MAMKSKGRSTKGGKSRAAKRGGARGRAKATTRSKSSGMASRKTMRSRSAGAAKKTTRARKSKRPSGGMMEKSPPLMPEEMGMNEERKE